MSILNYFDRLAIIHLPERQDRFLALRRELSRIGIDINDSKVRIPDAPVPESANGFPSKGVYGNFLSHLDILESAYRDGLNSVWVMEDDAIFSRRFRIGQQRTADYLRASEWDMFFIGHSISQGLPTSPTGLLRFSGPFLWAHSYAVHRRVMLRLIEYLRQTIDRNVGHPDGGKMYIDAAHCLFRKFNPDVVCVVSSPRLSVQKGSPSSLNSAPWYDRNVAAHFLVTRAREVRDEIWRQGWLPARSADSSDYGLDFKSSPAPVWPGVLSNDPANRE
jgi:glycosyl transferase, family 25